MSNNRPYKAITIANYFLDLAEKSGEFLSPMKVQKLVYFAHGWNLAIRKKPLVDEDIEAWQYGPVIPSVYNEFKKFGGNAIAHKAQENETIEPEFDVFTPALLKKVWVVYGQHNALDLSKITHLPNSPWSQAKEKSNKTRAAISDDIIQNHFVKELNLDTAKDEQCA